MSVRTIILFSCIISFFPLTKLQAIKSDVSSSPLKATLQQLIDRAGSGDTIILKGGIYKEHGIVIDKPLTLTGVDSPVIDGENKGQIIFIHADHVVLRGLTIRNVGKNFVEDIAAIKIHNSKSCTIENIKVENAFFGIFFAKSEDCIIRGNSVSGSARNEVEIGNAIHLWYCKRMLIEDNRVTGHRDGIYFEFVTNSRIIRNSSRHQLRYGMHFMFSHDNEYFQNDFSNNDAGVAVMYSSHIYMHENRFSDNWSPISNGMLLKDITDSRIEKNVFDHNTVGIYAEGCDRNSIRHNDFTKNGWAVRIMGNCTENEFTENNFIVNTFDVVTNSSVSNNLFERNFWSEYSGFDLNKDGFGDLPFRPVKLFTYIVEQNPPSIILLRSLFIDLLNLAEKVTPVITPETLVDEKPMMKELKW